MLTLPGANPLRLCDGLSRRNFLSLGTLGLGGLTLADLFRLTEFDHTEEQQQDQRDHGRDEQ